MFWKKKDFVFVCEEQGSQVIPTHYLFEVHNKSREKIYRKLKRRADNYCIRRVGFDVLDYENVIIEAMTEDSQSPSIVSIRNKRLNRLLREQLVKHLSSKDEQDRCKVSRLIKEINFKVGCDDFPFTVVGWVNNNDISKIEEFLDSLECRGYSIGGFDVSPTGLYHEKEYTLLEITVK